MSHQDVRVCPVCERENPPERACCDCGASLAAIDCPPADCAQPNLTVDADTADTAGIATIARPYRIGASEATTANAPDLPPVWRGAPADVDAVLARARDAEAGDVTAQDWLDSLFHAEVLAEFTTSGSGALRELDHRWRAAWTRLVELCEAVRRAEEQKSARPRDGGGSAADGFDDLASVVVGKLAPPPQRLVNGALLLALTSADTVAALRGDVIAGLAGIAGLCPWFDAFWGAAGNDAASAVAARHLFACARDAAALELRRRDAATAARARALADSLVALRGEVQAALARVPSGDDDLDRARAATLLEAFDRLQSACRKVEGLDVVDPAFDAARRAAERLSSQALAAQRALAAAEQAAGVNALLVAPAPLLVGGAILAAALLLGAPAAVLALLALLAVGAGSRRYIGARATETALEQLRLFGLSARTFLRSDPGVGHDGTDQG